MTKERIVVTGAAGFIGSNLCRFLLDEGYRVTSIDNLSAGTLENLPSGTDFHKVDICDPDLAKYLEGATTLIHLAAKNCLADCAENPVETARINVMGTANVLQACVKAGIKHLVYADTSAEYEGVEDFPSRVDRVRPLSVYACAKRGGALMCDAFRHLHGLEVTTVRYFNVYGRAQDWRRVIPPVMSAFTIKLLTGERPYIYGSGQKRRDFIHVDDVNSFHLLLLKNESIRGKTYNLGSGTDHSILEVFNLVKEELGSGIEPIMKPDLPAEAERTLADISGTRAAGWEPRVSMRDGLRDFIKYTRERLEAAPLA